MDLGPLVPVVAVLTGLGWGWIGLKNRELSVNSIGQAMRPNRSAPKSTSSKIGVRGIEKITTDSGYETAAQIEALRDAPYLEKEKQS